MSIRFACPECKKQFQTPDEMAGKRIKCKGCSTVMVVPGAAIRAPAPAPSPQPRKQERVREEAPRESVSARPRRREREEEYDEPVEPSRPKRRGRDQSPRRKSSVAKWIAVLGLVGLLLGCLVCGGGGTAYYFYNRHKGAGDDLKFAPDNFAQIQVIDFDAFRNSAAYAQLQQCPNRNHFALNRTPDGKELDASRIVVASTQQLEQIFVLTMKREVSIRDLVSSNAQPQENTISGKKLYEVGSNAYHIDGKRVVFGPSNALKIIMARNREANVSDTMKKAMKDADFSRPAVTVVDFAATLGQLEGAFRMGNLEMPQAMVAESDFVVPMNVRMRMFCKDDDAAEKILTQMKASPENQLRTMSVRRSGSTIIVEGKITDPCTGGMMMAP